MTLKPKVKVSALQVLQRWSQGHQSDLSLIEMLTQVEQIKPLIIGNHQYFAMRELVKQPRHSNAVPSEWIPPV